MKGYKEPILFATPSTYLVKRKSAKTPYFMKKLDLTGIDVNSHKASLESAKNLHHSNIADIKDIGIKKKEFIVVMEYCKSKCIMK